MISNSDLPFRITDNAAYLFVFYLIKLAINEFSNRFGEEQSELARRAVSYLTKLYEIFFKIQLYIEMILCLVAFYANFLTQSNES